MIVRLTVRVVIVAACSLAAPTKSSGAELLPVADKRCNYLLRGTITPDDDRLFSSLNDVRVCLDSDGGSFAGGKALATQFMSEGIQTYVRRGDRCHSACALAFLGGSIWGDFRHASRTLEPGATLGFHAPYLTLEAGRYGAEDMDASFLVSMVIAQSLVADLVELKISRSFLSEFLLYPSKNTKTVRTVRDAALAGIDLDTSFSDPSISSHDAAMACETIFERHADAFADPVTAWTPVFEPSANSEFSKTHEGRLDQGETKWIMVSTIHSEETPYLTASCAFSPEENQWGGRGAVAWSNGGGAEPDFVHPDRVMRLDVPSWYFLPGDMEVSKLAGN